jgi:hypothetical protein
MKKRIEIPQKVKMKAHPHVLIEMSDEPDCRFVAAWLIKAQEAENLWLQAFTEPDFRDQTSLLWAAIIPDIAARALEILGELQHGGHVVVLDLYGDEWGLFSYEFGLLVRLGFFIDVGRTYRMAIPEGISLATVKQAAIDLMSTAYDAGDDLEILEPERLLHTLSKAETEASRRRLGARRGYKRRFPLYERV